jgi:hypothetical protein
MIRRTVFEKQGIKPTSAAPAQLTEPVRNRNSTMMKQSLATSRSLAAVCALAAATTTMADIGFPAAVTLCRGAAPQGTLIGIKQRERSNTWIYEGELYNDALTTAWGPRFNRETGAAMGVDVDSPNESDIPVLQEIFDRLDEAVLDFADAMPIANEAAGRTDVLRMAFDLEAGILAFQVEYFDEQTKIYVDSVTGGVIPHHGADDDIEPTVPSTSFASAVAVAEETLGAGWVSFGGESETEGAGTIVTVDLVNLKTGSLAQIDVAGSNVIRIFEYEAAGTQITRMNAIRAAWPLVVTDLAAAVAAAEAAYPGAGVNEVELEVETEKTGTTVAWRIGVITADLIEVDYFVDATEAIGAGFRFAAAPVNAVAGDINGDGEVSAADLSEILSTWGRVNPPMDLDGSGFVDAGDLSMFLALWR